MKGKIISRIANQYCQRCKNITRHKILYSKTVKNPPRDGKAASNEKYMTVECLGCESNSFRYVYGDEDMLGTNLINGYGKLYSTYTRYPRVIRNYNEIPSEYLTLLPENVLSIYEEVISAFANKCYLLTAVGLRTTIEAVCKDKNVNGSSLKEKIDNLYENRHLQKHETNELHGVKFLGNDSVHRIVKPTTQQLLTALRLIDNLLVKVYHLGVQTAHILDTMLTEYVAFEKKLEKGIKKFEISDEKTLEILLDDQYRRFDCNDLKAFETILISKIVSEEYTYLKLGKVKTVKTGEIQYYIISVNPVSLIEQLPF